MSLPTWFQVSVNHIVPMHAFNGDQQLTSIEPRTAERQRSELSDVFQQVAIPGECEDKKQLTRRLKGTEECDDALFVLETQQGRLLAYDVLLLLLASYVRLVADFYYKKKHKTH